MNEQVICKRLIDAKDIVNKFDKQETIDETELLNMKKWEIQCKEVIKTYQESLTKVNFDIKLKEDSIKDFPHIKLENYEISVDDKMRIAITDACKKALDENTKTDTDMNMSNFNIIDSLSTKLGGSNATCSDYEKYFSHAYRILADNNDNNNKNKHKKKNNTANRCLSIFSILKEEFFERSDLK